MASTRPWHADLPAPRAVPRQMSASELKTTMDDPSKRPGIDYLIVDVRRADMDEPDGKHIIDGAINLPAQTFYQTLPTLLPLLSRIPTIIFHCSSSNGRGPRCAGWYQDALDERGIEISEAVILTGGIKGFKEAYPGDVRAL